MEFYMPNETVNKKLPEKLYIYMGIENVIKTLKNKGVHLSKPDIFNDPFEELYQVNHIGSPKFKTWVHFRK